MQQQREESKSSSSDVEDLPPGFRFEPTDVELIDYYLRRRASRNGAQTYSFIHELDVYAHAPWDIVPAAIADHNDGSESMQQYYFFTCRRRSGNGSKRVNRNAGCGFWHCHGHDIVIRDPADPNRVIGHKIQLNFKTADEFNRKKTTKTSWIMHEYWLESDEFQELVLCRIYDKKRSSNNYDEDADQMVVRAAVPKRQRTETEEFSILQKEEEAERRGVKRQRVEDPESATAGPYDYDENSTHCQIVPHFVDDQQEPASVGLIHPPDDHQAPIQSQDMVLLEAETELRGDERQMIFENPEPSTSRAEAEAERGGATRYRVEDPESEAATAEPYDIHDENSTHRQVVPYFVDDQQELAAPGLIHPSDDHQAPIQSQVLFEEETELGGDEMQMIIDNPEPLSSQALVVADDQEFYDQLLANIIDPGPAPLTWDDSSYGSPLISWPEDNFAISNYLGGFW